MRRNRKFEMGLFEHPYIDEAKAKTALLLPECRTTARETARQAILLLKNDKNLLPLNKNMKTIAVIGFGHPGRHQFADRPSPLVISSSIAFFRADCPP
jgi:beta-glucosidase